MDEKIKPSIRVIEPDEKLLVVFPPNEIIDETVLHTVSDAIEDFKNKDKNTLVLANGMEVYIVKDGGQILLKDKISVDKT